MDPKAQAMAVFSKLVDMALAKSLGAPKAPAAPGKTEVSLEVEKEPTEGDEMAPKEDENALLLKLLGGE